MSTIDPAALHGLDILTLRLPTPYKHVECMSPMQRIARVPLKVSTLYILSSLQLKRKTERDDPTPTWLAGARQNTSFTKALLFPGGRRPINVHSRARFALAGLNREIFFFKIKQKRVGNSELFRVLHSSGGS